ncbi:MAG: hypothetical protein ACKOWG_18065, partial [Planctomycetia bacterium]
MTIATSLQASPDELPAIDIHSLSPASDTRCRSPWNGRRRHGLRGREKNFTAGDARRFGAPPSDG